MAALIFRSFRTKNGFPEIILNEGRPRDDKGLPWVAVWGSPKFRWVCCQVQLVFFSIACPGTHRSSLRGLR